MAVTFRESRAIQSDESSGFPQPSFETWAARIDPYRVSRSSLDRLKLFFVWDMSPRVSLFHSWWSFDRINFSGWYSDFTITNGVNRSRSIYRQESCTQSRQSYTRWLRGVGPSLSPSGPSKSNIPKNAGVNLFRVVDYVSSHDQLGCVRLCEIYCSS